jgi:hypothetical protein
LVDAENTAFEGFAMGSTAETTGIRSVHERQLAGDRRSPVVRNLAAIWLIGCLALAGYLFTWGDGERPRALPAAPAAVVGVAGTRGAEHARTKPIDQIRVGDRVAVEDAPTDEDLSFGDDVDPATWRRVLLRAPKDDGGWSDVTLLRPAAWLEANEVRRGAIIDLFILECGIDAPAEVLSVSECPPIAPGDGRIVTGTFRHHSRNIVDVFVAGLPEPIGTTVNHPFWSEDRQSFVSAGDLQSGERLLGLDGPSVVTAVVPRIEGATVYNLEVQVDHVYHVGSAGLLVHNACWPRHHPFPKYLGGAVDQTLRKMPRKLHEEFHSALDKWMNGALARRKGAEHFANMDKAKIIQELRDFYQRALNGKFKNYLSDFERALRESGY